MTGLELAVGPGNSLVLPIDYVTQVAAIVAQRRKGKTYTAAVIAEELCGAGLPWVALDPTGAWWGLRSSADGLSAGRPVVILGGQHGDAPLERGSGRYVAELVVDSPGWYVLDLSLLESRAAEREFAADFAEALLRRKRQPGKDFPLHLFVDEADMFAPQERETGDQRMLGAYQAIVRRGGLHGLGSTLITQRPALLNKSVLTQLDILILLRLVAGQDQDAVDKNYLRRAGNPDARVELLDSLASLRRGEAWAWAAGAHKDPARAGPGAQNLQLERHPPTGGEPAGAVAHGRRRPGRGAHQDGGRHRAGRGRRPEEAAGPHRRTGTGPPARARRVGGRGRGPAHPHRVHAPPDGGGREAGPRRRAAPAPGERARGGPGGMGSGRRASGDGDQGGA